MADPSFDVVSKVDHQEADNALNQAQKELAQRFDFRGTDTNVQWSGDDGVTFSSSTDERIKAALEVFKEKLIKRGISLKSLEAGEPQSSGKGYKLQAKIVEGIEADKARQISKAIRDAGLKGIQAQIQGDQLRVTGKKKDQLQEVIALLKGEDFGIALQFTNYR
ncbi:MAG: YajQ family cyclic di-GMP-binding protein [Antricoccus sp.]